MGSPWNAGRRDASHTSHASGVHLPSFVNSAHRRPETASPMTVGPEFDNLEWYPAYQSCQRYFLDHAQYEPATQALCALINIRLPFQWSNSPVTSSQAPQPGSIGPGSSSSNFNAYTPMGSNSSRSRAGPSQGDPSFVSLVPYIRRLVITAFDKVPILHGFFGNDYAQGIVPLVDCERRNYLFAAKHGGWRSCKKQYDHGNGCGGDESVPFMKPLDGVKMEELAAAEKAWFEWLAMEDWMVGPRAPGEVTSGTS